MYGEGVRGIGQEPGFRVVKKNVAAETPDDEPITDLNVKEWEVRSEWRSFLTWPGAASLVLYQTSRIWIKSLLLCWFNPYPMKPKFMC